MLTYIHTAALVVKLECGRRSIGVKLMGYSGKQEVILLSNLMVQITLDLVRNRNMVIERICVDDNIVWSLDVQSRHVVNSRVVHIVCA